MKTATLSLAALAGLMLASGTASAGGIQVSTTLVGHHGSPHYGYPGYHHGPVHAWPPAYGLPAVVVPFPGHPPVAVPYLGYPAAVYPPVPRVYRYHYYPRPYGSSFSYRGNGFAISLGF